MSNEKPIAAIQGTGTLVKPLFSRGLLLEDEDLTAGVTYTRDLVRLMFRSLFGCGVICGLKVSADPDCHNSRIKVTVTKGLGLDCFGNPIEVKRDETLTYDPECKPFVPELWVLACYRENPCRPKDATCAADEESQVVQTRTHGGYELSLVSARPKCACSCEPAEQPPPSDECCGGAVRTPQPAPPAAPARPAQPAPGAMQVVAGAADRAKLDYCECYRKHYEFHCDCDCGCKCIVIGKIKVVLSGDQLKEVEVDSRVVRYIRPALIGYENCREVSRSQRSAVPADQQPEAPQPA
jgi:hypothetical protein